MSISGLTALSQFTDKAPASPAYFNAKFAEIAANFSALTTNAQSTLSGAGLLFASEYGVTADGATDDTTAIRNVLTTGAATGKTVIFSAGTHRLTGTVSFPTGVKAQGAGKDGTIFYAATAGITMSTASADVWVDGIYFKGSGTSNGGERGLDTDAARVRVTNCRFGQMTSGIRYSGVAAADGLVTGCEFTGIVGKFGVSEGYGVQASGTRLLVSGNRFTDIMRHAIYFASTASGCAAVGNTISGLSQHAIQVYATDSQAGCFNTVIAGNVISDLTQAVGIRVADYAQHTVITGNTISRMTGNNSYGIFIGNGDTSSPTARCKRTVVSGNMVENIVGTFDCILLQNADDVVVSGNLLSGNSTGYGVLIQTSSAASNDQACRNILVSGNHISGCTYPVFASGSSVSNVVVAGNLFTGNTFDRVRSTTSRIRIEGERVLALASLTTANITFGESAVAYGASGCSLAFRASDGTLWYPNSSLSTVG